MEEGKETVAEPQSTAAEAMVTDHPAAEHTAPTESAVATEASGDQAAVDVAKEDEPQAMEADEPAKETAAADSTVEANVAGGDAKAMEAEEAKEQVAEAGDIKTDEASAKEPEVAKAAPAAAQPKKPKVDAASLPTRQYLDQSVVPILLQGLSWLAKTRPEDPITALSNYLVEHKTEFESDNLNGSA